MFINSRNDW